MPLPPKNPFKEKQSTYFIELVNTVKDDFKRNGIDLNFRGYIETIEEYQNLDYRNKDQVWRVSKSLNSWSEYMSDLKGETKKLFLDAETDKITQIAIASIKYDPKNNSNGKRGADMNEDVIKARKTRNSFDAFYEELDNKVEFLKRAFHHAKMMLKDDIIQ